MSKSKLLYNIAFGAVYFLASLLVFLIFGFDSFSITTFVFLTISILFFYFTPFILKFFSDDTKNTFPLKIPVFALSTTYITIVCVVSFLFQIIHAIFAGMPVRAYLVIQIIIVIIFILVCSLYLLVFNSSSENIRKQQEKVSNLREEAGTISMLVEKVKTIEIEENVKEEVSELLNDLYEKIRFSDPMTNQKTEQTETAIKANISGLKQQFETNPINLQEIKNLISQISLSIEERNNIIKNSK